MSRKIRVIVGPHRLARRYANSKGWADGEYIIVTRGHQLAHLDPAMMLSIVMVQLHSLGVKIVEEIHEEIERVRALWPVQMEAA